ncbi:hypothetical protein ScPMuIL_008783 [Solemya velum]
MTKSRQYKVQQGLVKVLKLQVRPENVEDGRSIQEKMELMKILHDVEINTEKKHGLTLTNHPVPNSYLYQGDIVLNLAQAQALKDISSGRQKRKLIANLAERWQLPIQYSLDTRYTSDERQFVEQALQAWEQVTCITFKEVNYSYGISIDDPIVQFVRGEGCWSSVGRNSSTTQKVSIGSGCFMVGVIAHEIGHVIGFWHEQSRPDRDNHVIINFDNVQYGNAGNFQVQSWQNVDNKDIPYDVGSIMHYGSMAYTREGKRTIETRDPLLQHTIGQREAMSFYDIKLANLAYCQAICDPKLLKSECLHDGYQNPKDCRRCRCPDGLTGPYCEQVALSYRAKCGGVVNVSSDLKYIETPSFPGEYNAGVMCNWLLRAPVGSNIYLHLRDDFVQYQQCANTETEVCRDYIEVKYYNNLAGTGARFCCSKKPKGIIRSHGNTMLVLFRSLGNGTLGFRASVSTESCGGCAAATPPSQKSCLKRVSYSCAKTWKRKAIKQCSWWTDKCGYSM